MSGPRCRSRFRALQQIRAPDQAAKSRTLSLLVPLLIPLGVLGLLVAHWHGLVPPAWQSTHELRGAISTTPLCYLLAVFALLGAFYQWALPAD